MTDSSRRPLPLWAGRTTALLGILLVALNLRTAVTSLSPVVSPVTADIPLDAIGLALLGTIPPIVFSLSGLFGPAGAHRLGLERFTVVAIVVMVVGYGLRAAAWDFPSLFAGTALGLIGAGLGNILLPPLVKRYFPDRIGLVTSAYATVIAVSTGLPAALAVPVADSSGWRASLAVWCVLATVSLLPWLVMLARARRDRLARLDTAPEVQDPEPQLLRRIWHSKVAWAVTLLFGMTSFHAYANFAWLPQLVMDTAGVSEFDAGVMLSIFGFVGIPTSIIVPILATRLKNFGLLVYTGVACYLIGYAGLLLAPGGALVLWVVLLGGGQMLFPAALVIINLRTRTQRGAVALSGFAQGVGYALAATGPLFIGILHDATGGWTAPIMLLLSTNVVLVVVGFALRKRTFVEDELHV